MRAITMGEEVLTEVKAALAEMLEDTTVPKNVKEKVHNSLQFLNHDIELSIKVNKVLSELEELSDDINMQAYTRTQIWNIVSLLEKALL